MGMGSRSRSRSSSSPPPPPSSPPPPPPSSSSSSPSALASALASPSPPSSSSSSSSSPRARLRLWRAILVVMVVASATAMAASAYDPAPLQDFCVADTSSSSVRVNGFVCRDGGNVTGADFSSALLRLPANASASAVGYAATRAYAATFPALNTQGISAARSDFAAGGVNPPHVHPRAAELLYLLQGTLFVGFITTDEKLYSATIRAGDLFVFPQGLVHFQLNVGSSPAAAFASFSSQNPGTLRISRALFASSPAIDDRVLSRSFGLNATDIRRLRQIIASL